MVLVGGPRWKCDGAAGLAAWCGHCARWHWWQSPDSPFPEMDLCCPCLGGEGMEPDGYPADCGQPMTEAERMELRCQLSGLGWRWRDPARGNLLPRLVLALGGLRVGQVYRLGIAGGGEPPPSLARLGFTAAPAEHWWHGFVESAGPEPREEEVACGPDQDHVRRSVLSYALGLLPGEVREAMIS